MIPLPIILAYIVAGFIIITPIIITIHFYNMSSKYCKKLDILYFNSLSLWCYEYCDIHKV